MAKDNRDVDEKVDEVLLACKFRISANFDIVFELQTHKVSKRSLWGERCEKLCRLA